MKSRIHVCYTWLSTLLLFGTLVLLLYASTSEPLDTLAGLACRLFTACFLASLPALALCLVLLPVILRTGLSAAGKYLAWFALGLLSVPVSALLAGAIILDPLFFLSEFELFLLAQLAAVGAFLIRSPYFFQLALQYREEEPAETS